jgi:hypothetical protein
MLLVRFRQPIYFVFSICKSSRAHGLRSTSILQFFRYHINSFWKMSANTTVHAGFWVNHAKGEVLGATLTLKKTNAAFLIAALAVFIQVCSSRIGTMEKLANFEHS